MIKVAVVYERTSDQCCWYRSTGPFCDPIFRKENIHFTYITKHSPEQWGDIGDADIVFFLRPHRKIEYDMIVLALSLNKKVWIDYDDDFTVPEQCNWASQNIKTPMFFQASLRVAHRITVSTPALKVAYEKLTPKPIEVIPNGFNFDFLSNIPKKDFKPTKSIAWRGSATHEKDLGEVARAYTEVLKKYPEFISFFYGNYPKFVAFYVNHTYLNYPVPQFHQVLADNRHKIIMHPLEDTQWNTGKSNAAWLEGTMSGSLAISRDLPEWRVPNCYTYKTPEEFATMLQYLIEMPEEEHKKSVELGKEYIYEHRNLSKLNERRLTIIKELLD